MKARGVSLAILAVALVSPRGLFAQTLNCNLAPNAAFEQGTTAIDQWFFAAVTGAAIFAVANYPSPVQSGARSARIVVTQPGDIFLATAEPGQIPALPDTSYLLSVRVKADAGKVAGIRILEWSGSAVTADRFLGYGTGTGDWGTVENTFTTTSSTTSMSVRLMHHIHSGTFYWDDVMLARQCAGERCVDSRHYIAQTKPGFKMCSDASATFCLDGVKTANKEYLEGASNQERGYVSHTLASRAMIGTQKAFSALEGWRCFANPGEACGAARTSPGQNAQFPPGVLGLSFSVPVWQGPVATDQVTEGAARLFDWQLFDVRVLNPSTGQSAGLVGTISHRAAAFLLPSRDFGGTLGVQKDVLVVEGESGTLCPAGFAGGARLERYMLVRGFGVVYAEGRLDVDCDATPSTTTCDGFYTLLGSGSPVSLVHRVNGDLAIGNDAPHSFNAVDWW